MEQPKVYISGNSREKKHIDQLVYGSNYDSMCYDYIDLCENLAKRMVEEKVKNVDDFDYTLCQYLSELEEDAMQVTGLPAEPVVSYLLKIEVALYYFRSYLETINQFPLRNEVTIRDGTRGSVMMIVVHPWKVSEINTHPSRM